MRKRIKWLITAAVLLVAAGAGCYNLLRTPAAEEGAGGAGPAAKGGVLHVNALVIRPQHLTDDIFTTSTLLPDEEVDLSFETSGKIVSIDFEEGTPVKKGQLLAKVNDKPLQAQLSKYKAQVKLAEDRVYRQSTLLEKDAVSQEAYEQARTELATLNADIELCEANIALTELRAPFDGIIGLRMVSEGSYASPSTVVAKLTKISPIKIEFSIPESYATEVGRGSRIVFKMEQDGLMKDYGATIYAVESTIDEPTRSLKVRARYPNANESIVPGRYVSVEITKSEIKDALVVPSEAVIPEMGRQIVYLYKGGKAEPREIVLGLRTEDKVQALEGLERGDTVLVSGVMQLRTGMPVRIENLKAGGDD